MTLNKWAYDILNEINPLLVDDEEVNLRQVKDWILDYRAEFLKNNLNSYRQIESNISQTIPELQLDFELTSVNGDKVFKTTKRIPNIIMMQSGPAIVRVGPKDLGVPSWKVFSDLKAVSFAGNGRFNKYQVFAYLQNDFLYIKTKDPSFPLGIDNQISITAVFENPKDLSEFNDEQNPVYSDEHTDFPMNRDMRNYIFNAIKQQKFAITENSNPDKENDGEDNSDRPTQTRR